MSILAALALLNSVATPAPVPPPADPMPPENPAEARSGKLMTLQLWSVDQQRFLKEWSQPTPPKLTTNTKTERNKPIFQFILFGGCQADDAGNCNLSAVVTMTDPEGVPYGEPHNFSVWDNQPAPPPNVLSLAPGGIAISFEDDEKLGIYKVRMAVTDNNAKVTATSKIEITALEVEGEKE